MKLIIGLGNPEERYAHTRHNTGFEAISHYLQAKGGVLQQKDKFKARVAELTVSGERALCILPTTYYNNSGEAARAIADFYKLAPEDVLIVHDELALPFGSIRTRIGGGDAGNNGVKSVTEHLGPDTSRIRIGIYNDLRDRIDDADFVLSKFTNSEADELDKLYPKVATIIDAFIAGEFEPTTHN